MTQPVPWMWMLICAVTTTSPLVLGWMRGEFTYAIFGALTGYLIALNDQGGVRYDRVWIATLSAAAFYFALLVGLELKDLPVEFTVVVAALTYLLGLFAGKGGEIERLLLFSIVQLLISRYAITFPEEALPHIRVYILVAYLTLICALICALVPLALRFQRAPRPPIVRLRDAWRTLHTRHLARHTYALTYTVAVLGALTYIEHFHVARGYWTVITTLFVLRPDRRESVDRIWQRLFGTLAGVWIGGMLLHLAPSPPWLILGVFACAGLVPYVWLRNYWLVTFLATNFVLMLLSLAVPGHLEDSVTTMRLSATLQGCAIGAGALVLNRALEWVAKPRG